MFGRGGNKLITFLKKLRCVSVQNLFVLFSYLVYKNVKIKIYKTNFTCFLYGWQNSSLMLVGRDFVENILM
jgi:hypothetical protein